MKQEVRIYSVEVRSFLLYFLKSIDITHVYHRYIGKNLTEEKNKFQMLGQKNLHMLFITLSIKPSYDVTYHNLLPKELLCRYTLKNQSIQVLQLSPLCVNV